MTKGLNILILIYAIIFCLLLFSCSVSKPPTVKAFVITGIYEGFFAAKNGNTTLLFSTQDSIFIGRVIYVSIGTKSKL